MDISGVIYGKNKACTTTGGEGLKKTGNTARQSGPVKQVTGKMKHKKAPPEE
jgi:hypothetical protein